MLSSLLHASGIFMGNDRKRNEESEFFQAINIRLLDQCGFNWTAPGVPQEVSIRLPALQFLCRYVKAPAHPQQLIRLLSGSAWGWKDPRNTFTLAAWLRVFPQAKVIHIYRNGMDVALSLHHRNMKTPRADKCRQPALKLKPAGLDLWQQYVAQAFSFESLLGERMLTLQFEKLVSCDEKEVEKLERFTGLELRGRIEAMADQKRTARYLDPEHEDLVRYAGKMEWMKKLGYCAEGSLA
jgi:hypothetical protein